MPSTKLSVKRKNSNESGNTSKKQKTGKEGAIELEKLEKIKREFYKISPNLLLKAVPVSERDIKMQCQEYYARIHEKMELVRKFSGLFQKFSRRVFRRAS